MVDPPFYYDYVVTNKLYFSVNYMDLHSRQAIAYIHFFKLNSPMSLWHLYFEQF